VIIAKSSILLDVKPWDDETGKHEKTRQANKQKTTPQKVRQEHQLMDNINRFRHGGTRGWSEVPGC